MNKVRVDREKNRLYLTLTSGGKAEMEFFEKVVINSCKNLKRGFSCLTDISEYGPIDKEREERLVKTQIMLWQAGMGKVVRVKKSKALCGYMDLDKASLSTGYTESLVKDLVEAEEMLDAEPIEDFFF